MKEADRLERNTLQELIEEVRLEREERQQRKAAKNGFGGSSIYGYDITPAPPVLPIINPFPITLSQMPRRPWLVPGLLLRRQLSLMVAPAGSGKSLLTLQLGMVATAGIREWGGWRTRGKYRVLIINVEEDEDEMRRRLGAAAKVMNIDQNEMGGLFIARTDSVVIARADNRTKTVTATPMLGQIEKVITDNAIDIIIVDPFAETFAGDENSNSELKWAAILWRDVARRTNSSIMLIHHTKKYSTGMAGDPDAGRGASALTGVARVVGTLFNMTDKEAAVFADQKLTDGSVFDPDNRNRYIRFDDAKANQSLVSRRAKWFFKTSVSLENASDDEPADEVGVLVPWQPPSIWGQMDVATANLILNQLQRGYINDDGSLSGDPFNFARQKSGKRWAGTVIEIILQCDDKDATIILKKWLIEGVIEVRKMPTSISKGKDRDCVFVNNSKRPGQVTEELAL
jgi:AAA domain